MKLGRNDPCHCGSGRKYKHCHYEEDRKAEAKALAEAAEARRAEAEQAAESESPDDDGAGSGAAGGRGESSRGGSRFMRDSSKVAKPPPSCSVLIRDPRTVQNLNPNVKIQKHLFPLDVTVRSLDPYSHHIVDFFYSFKI